MAPTFPNRRRPTPLLAARLQLTRTLYAPFRRKIWISLAAAEAVFLLVALFKFQ